MGRMFPDCGQVKDVDGITWNVRDVRTTKHGFDLHFGVPADNHGAYRGGLPRLIATPALRDFWDTNRLEGGLLYDLPAGPNHAEANSPRPAVQLQSRLGGMVDRKAG